MNSRRLGVSTSRCHYREYYTGGCARACDRNPSEAAQRLQIERQPITIGFVDARQDMGLAMAAAFYRMCPVHEYFLFLSISLFSWCTLYIWQP